MIGRILVRCLLLLVATLLSLFVLELGLTAWYGDLAERGPLELVEGWDSPFIFQRVAGARPADSRAPGQRYRILSYGDSIAGGFGIDGEEMYAHRLQARFEAGPELGPELITMDRGHSPTLYSFHLRRDVPRLQPDAVLMQIELLNDVSDEAMARTSGRDVDGLPLGLRSYRYILGWDGHILAPLSFSGSLVERTKLYAKLSRWFGRVLERLRPNPVFSEESNTYFYSHGSERWLLTESALATGFERLFDVLAATHGYLDARDVRFLLLILPSRYVYTDNQYTLSSRALLKRAEDRATALGIPFLSPIAEIGQAGGAELFLDFCHPTANGNLAIANALEPVVLERWLAAD